MTDKDRVSFARNKDVMLGENSIFNKYCGYNEKLHIDSNVYCVVFRHINELCRGSKDTSRVDRYPLLVSRARLVLVGLVLFG